MSRRRVPPEMHAEGSRFRAALEGHALSWPQPGGRDGARPSKPAHFSMVAVQSFRERRKLAHRAIANLSHGGPDRNPGRRRPLAAARLPRAHVDGVRRAGW